VGFRVGLLSYKATEPVGVELSMAEAGAGGGGALIQPHYGAPEIRRKFRRFFGEHRELFEGFKSQADVGVLFAYDQLYWGNPSNVQAIYRLCQYLSEQHVLFDLVSSGAPLSRYSAVITPYLRYASDRLMGQLRSYAAAGGTWLDIGDSGQFDDAGKLRALSDRTEKGRILLRRDLNDVLPYPRFALYMMKEDDANELKEVMNFVRAAQAGEILTPAAPKEDLRKLLGLEPVLPGAGLEGLKCNVWRKSGKTVAHFVNYYCPIPIDGQPGAPKALEKIAVRLKIPFGKVTSVRVFDPDSTAPVSLPHTQKGPVVEFVLPAVRIYLVVELSTA
jgi:hypothetical protein